MATGTGFNKVVVESFDVSLLLFNIQVLFGQTESDKFIDAIHWSYSAAPTVGQDSTLQAIAGRLMLCEGILTEAEKAAIDPTLNTIPDGLTLLGDWKITQTGPGFIDMKGARFSAQTQLSVILVAPLLDSDSWPTFQPSIGSLMVLGRYGGSNDPFAKKRE